MADRDSSEAEEFERRETVLQFHSGQRLFGRYELDRMLGRGGMGVVWLARDDSLQRRVALKFLPEVMLQDRGALEELREETRRNLEITHPHIVRIYDFEEDSDFAGIAMEYVDGDTLAALRAGLPERVFAPLALLPWIKQLCEALHYAHTDPRIVHRDLKPANLMSNARGQLKITDFGIARSITDSVSRVSNHRGTSGTLVYMSPQQLMGETATPADDVYSIGATLYDLITSKPPFYTGAVAAQIQHGIPPSMTARRAELQRNGPPIPPEFERTVQACLAKSPALRPPSVLAIYEWLAHAASPRDVPPRAASAPSPLPPPPPPPPPAPALLPIPPHPDRKGALSALGALLLGGVLVVCGGLGWHFFADRGPGSASAPPHEKGTPTPLDATPAPLAAIPPLAAATPSASATPSPATPEPSRVGRLLINTVPSHAMIYVDEREAGNSPLAIDNVSTGLRRLKIALKGYQDAELMIEVASGQTSDPGPIHLAAEKSGFSELTPREKIATLGSRLDGGALTDDAVLTLVRLELFSAEKGDLESTINCFANPVDYYDEGRLFAPQLRRSLEEYRRKWPLFDVSGLSPISVLETPDPSVKTAAFTYLFVARNTSEGKWSRGMVHEQVTVRSIGGRPYIIRCRQTITDRQKNF